MGKNLFIRVSAKTFDEKQVQKTWPSLYNIAWPEKFLHKDATLQAVQGFSGQRPKGVLELIESLGESVDFGTALSKQAKAELQVPLKKIILLVQGLEDALANRDVPVAHKMTCDIEDGLDALELIAQRVLRELV